jgi:hypothetical protein
MTTTTAPTSTPPAPGWPPHQTPAPPPPPGLAVSSHGTRLPPPDLVRPHDPDLARLIEAVAAADGASFQAADTWERAAGYREALAEDRGYVLEHLDATGEIPDPHRGPLAAAPRRAHHAYVAAMRAEVAAAWAHGRVVAHARAADEVRSELDQRTDELRDEVARLLTEARDRGDRRAYDDAMDVVDRWRPLAALWHWLGTPERPYVAPRGRALPAELEYLEWEADGAITGQHRPEVPGEALRLPGAPPPADQEGPGRRGIFGRRG